MAAAVLRAIKEGKARALAARTSRCAATICIHSDTPNAVDIARAVREAVNPILMADQK